MTSPTLWLDPGNDPLYLAIVKAIRRDIRSGRLRPGSRLPTHRELADELGVAVGTVTRAYAEAERQGLVQGEIGRGTFVADRQTKSDPAIPLAPSASRPFLDLSQNYPLYSEDPDLASALRHLADDPELARLTQYHSSDGLLRHREIGARWIERFGATFRPADVVVTAGAQHAMTCALAAVARPGELLLTEELTYPGIRGVADTLHLKLGAVAMDEHGIRPDALRSLCRQRKARALYVTPTAQNPTAATIPLERRREIVEIAREYDLWILEDEVHRVLVGSDLPPFAALAPGRTFLLAGTSKSVCGGLRVAFLGCPANQTRAAIQSVWATVWMVPPLCVEVIARWIDDGTAEETIRRKRDECTARQRLAAEILAGHRFRAHPHGLTVWLDLPEPWTSATFVAAARARGVSVTPSGLFRIDDSEPPNAVRICLGAVPRREDAAEALRILVEVLESAEASTAGFV